MCLATNVAKIQLLYPSTKLNLRDRVLGEIEKNSFIALPDKGCQCPQNCVFQSGGGVRSSIVMVQRGGHDQLMDILLIGWWWGYWGSATSTFWFQLVCGLCTCGQHMVNFFHLMGVSVPAEQLKDTVMYIPWRRTKTLPQGCTIVSWLLLPCLCIPSLPWLATVWACPLEFREGHESWIKPISCKQGTGDTERLLCPGAPEGPAQFQDLFPCCQQGVPLSS